MTLEQLRQALCGLTGHNRLLRYEDARLALKCVSCGHETPGWALDGPPPTITRRRHALNRPRLVPPRRIA